MGAYNGYGLDCRSVRADCSDLDHFDRDSSDVRAGFDYVALEQAGFAVAIIHRQVFRRLRVCISQRQLADYWFVAHRWPAVRDLEPRDADVHSGFSVHVSRL